MLPIASSNFRWVAIDPPMRQHGLRLDPPLELFVQTLDRVRCSRASPLTWRQPCEGEQAVAGFLEAVGDRAMAQPPLADEGLAALLDLLGLGRINHVGVVGGHLVVQSLRRM